MDDHTADTTTVICAGVLFLALVASYIHAFRGSPYVTNKWWLGLDASCVYGLTIMQGVAAIGFLGMLVVWGQRAPRGGLFDHASRPYGLAACVSTLLVASIVWALVLDSGVRWLAVLPLVVVACCAIALVVGAFTETEPRATAVIFSLLFGTVTVLADGVGWNARFLQTTTHARVGEGGASLRSSV